MYVVMDFYDGNVMGVDFFVYFIGDGVFVIDYGWVIGV